MSGVSYTLKRKDILSTHKVFSRLDYNFIFKRDIAKGSRCEILSISITDHAPVIMKLKLNMEKEETLWRMKNSLLEDQDLKNKMENRIKFFFEINYNGEVTTIILWETAKATLQGDNLQIGYESVRTKSTQAHLNIAKKNLKQ